MEARKLLQSVVPLIQYIRDPPTNWVEFSLYTGFLDPHWQHTNAIIFYPIKYKFANYFINVFAVAMDSGVMSAPLIMRAISFTHSSPVISTTDVVVLSPSVDFDIL